jgi:excisionase family DNA binding protein
VREVARWMRVNPATVYRLANAGKMPYFKAGRDFRFRRDEIDAWSKTFGREHPVASKATRPRRKRSKTPSYMKVPIVPAVEGDF